MDTTSTLPRAAAPDRDAAAPAARDAARHPRPSSGASRPGRLLHRTWRGRPEDPAWVRPGLLGLLALTAFLFVWDLGASGWANSFYSAAVQAGSESWKAFFFGSSDAANSITVDKTPLALWPMELSVRIFGLSSWSILVPQALEGVATVGLLYATVRRATASPVAGLVSGLVLALTPVAALMFRFNNPDAMLVLLLVGAAAATLRAVEASREGRPVRWLALAGALVGLAFLAKMLQAFLVLPALVLVYLLFAHTSIPRRLGHLLVAFVSMVLAAGWWVAIVALWPASDRPYIGGSQTNSILELTLGYNGFGRLTGNETGSVGGGGGGAGGNGGGMWGSTGILRLFGTEVGGQIAWLLPAALVLGAATLWVARRQRQVLAATTLWLGWLLVTGLTFSFMAGIFHAYYTVALAPAIAALVGVGAWTLWRARRSLLATSVLSFTVAMTTVFAWYLLDEAGSWLPWLKWVVVSVGLVAALGVALIGHLPGRVAGVVAGVALAATLAGPAAYVGATVTTPHTGSIVAAGPSSVAHAGPGGAGGPGGQRGGTPPALPGQTGTTQAQGQTGQTGATQAQGQTGQTGTAQTRGGGMAGLLDGSTSTSAITKLLSTDASSYTWVAAAVGSQNASGYQLATQQPVMAIGGFNGSDPSPTLAQFQAWVKAGKIHYFIGGSGFGGGSGSSDSSAIATWVAAHYTAKTVDGVTLYDLSVSK